MIYFYRHWLYLLYVIFLILFFAQLITDFSVYLFQVHFFHYFNTLVAGIHIPQQKSSSKSNRIKYIFDMMQWISVGLHSSIYNITPGDDTKTSPPLCITYAIVDRLMLFCALVSTFWRAISRHSIRHEWRGRSRQECWKINSKYSIHSVRHIFKHPQ